MTGAGVMTSVCFTSSKQHRDIDPPVFVAFAKIDGRRCMKKI
jgi:hypothetical protein